MTNIPETNTEKQFGTLELLLMAAWFGLVTGLVEGAGMLILQKFGWQNWDMGMIGVWNEILWISPFLDLLLFVGLGLVVALPVRLLPAKWRLPFCVLLFSFLMFADWCELSGRIRLAGSMLLAAGMASVAARWAKSHEVAAQRVVRRSLPAAAALAVLAFAGVESVGYLQERMQIARLAPAPSGTPNLLVIVVDTLRSDHLSSYGYTRNTSPHIDELAQQGVKFDRAFAASSWTLPSHASLLTGRFPHDIDGVDHDLYANYPTISEVLRDHGYQTAAFSGNTFFFTRFRGFGRGFHHFEDVFASAKDMALRTLYGRKFVKWVMLPLRYEDLPARRLAGDINGALLHWLDRHPGKPFFAFLNYMDTHDPYLPPQPYRSRFSKLPNPGGRINEPIGRDRPKLTPEQLQSEIDAYDGAIAYVDDEIGKLMQELKKRGLAENTVVVITSDHGESFGEHGLFTHRNALYRNLIQVPLVFYCPAKIPAGVRIGTPVSNVSLASTLAALAGTGGQNVFSGTSLAEAWTSTQPQGDFLPPLSELSQMKFEGMKPAPTYYGDMRSLVNSDWQYIQNDALGVELFRWEADPAETQNLAKTPEGQPVVEEFSARMRALLSGASPASVSKGPERKR